MRTPCHTTSAFTLVETTIGMGVALLLGGIIYTLLSVGMTLYTQGLSLGQTHSSGMATTERLFLDIAAADEVPLLADDTGAAVSGNGPAAGISFYNVGSSQPYGIPNAVWATSYSMTITKTSNQPAPQTGDKITMTDLGFQGVIAAVTSFAGTHTLWFSSTIGSGFVPTQTLGIVIPAGSKCFLLQPSSFISVNGVLRYYPRAKSISQNGSNAFNNPTNFVVVAGLLPASGQTNAFPFQYLDPSRRSIDVNLPLRSAAYGSKVSGFYAYQNLKTTIAYRTAVTQ